MTDKKVTGAPSPAGKDWPGEEPSTILKGRIAALETELAELRGYLPMLARMAFFEHWEGGSIPDVVQGLQEFARCYEEDARGDHPEFRRPKSEPLPAAAQTLQDAYDVRTVAEMKALLARQGLGS